MTISIDSNILSTIWKPNEPLREQTARALDGIRTGKRLVICGFVYAEMLPVTQSAVALDRALDELGVEVEWEMGETVFRSAGKAFAHYVERRRIHSRKQSNALEPRRLMTDFLIGAHAMVHGYAIVTRDKRLFRAAYPKLQLVRV